mmetsp:Transcript_1869/g.4137  ORF Transcript_1869/g.4137 Transcript_1869/m.4137 type:complete len:88 (+) Transcript_1869:162-425(+)
MAVAGGPGCGLCEDEEEDEGVETCRACGTGLKKRIQKKQFYKSRIVWYKSVNQTTITRFPPSGACVVRTMFHCMVDGGSMRDGFHAT